MSSPIVIFAGWIVHALLCFYFVRFISDILTRCVLTCIPCIILTYMVTMEVPPFLMSSMLLITYCWLASIRLTHLIILSPNQCTTLRSFFLKLLWMAFPIVPCTNEYAKEWPILYDFLLAGIKLLINHWMYRWLLDCPGSDSYARLMMFYTYVLAYTFLSDFQCGIVRIVTRDKYMLKSLTNFPLLSRSLREFWGRRYNQLIGTILRESVFQPVLQYVSYPSIAALIAFFVSGIMHIHLAYITFEDLRDTFSTMTFFLLNGLACTIEANLPFRLPEVVSWSFTMIFLFLTTPLQNGSFTKLGPSYYAANKPPLIDNQWIPRLPVPNFCLQ